MFSLPPVKPDFFPGSVVIVSPQVDGSGDITIVQLVKTPVIVDLQTVF
jgi:hypothetical protein